MDLLGQTQVGPEVDHFVTVPETTLPSGIIVPSFQVGKYACTKGIDGKATVSATDVAPYCCRTVCRNHQT